MNTIATVPIATDDILLSYTLFTDLLYPEKKNHNMPTNSFLRIKKKDFFFIALLLYIYINPIFQQQKQNKFL